MNINPKAIKIICYGDSNTWGYIPISGDRYPANVRWTGVLQKGLGDSYAIIEEGLNGRTTNVADPIWGGRSGKLYLLTCLETHAPFDAIILFLGTNDLKKRFNRSAQQVGKGLEELITIIQKNYPDIKIMVVCPARVDESVGATQKSYQGAEKKSVQLPVVYGVIARSYGLPLVNLQEVVQSSKKDGFHFEPQEHAVIAKAIEKVIKSKGF